MKDLKKENDELKLMIAETLQVSVQRMQRIMELEQNPTNKIKVKLFNGKRDVTQILGINQLIGYKRCQFEIKEIEFVKQ